MIISDYWLIPLGFLGQAMFGARTIAQCVIAEREGRSVSPVIFWIFSVIGSSLFLLYGVFRHDAVIMVGQTISFYIYVRNLQLKGVWASIPVYARIPMLFIPPALLLYSRSLDFPTPSFDFTDFLMVVGMIGHLSVVLFGASPRIATAIGFLDHQLHSFNHGCHIFNLPRRYSIAGGSITWAGRLHPEYLPSL
jgi:lipid-A-disaccharide synthase-like uncharacterized protein